ncbi:MAG: hypothetical protein KGI91_12505 [Burkholderiales bacterium]|nr:hypothetical protein [Burkholderiales bacterium]MDE2077874.1 hypothetical protein [Burkholderiales bacterium]MDE2431652.1 hypothetical protein [Burkholderiales bacterium]
MHRCLKVLAALALAVPVLAQAQNITQRQFPANSLRGELQITQPPDALLNGQPVRLAPGARIRGGDNLLVMSGAIQGQKYPVIYTIDTYGLLINVWLLREDEAGKLWPKTAEEAASWTFDPVAQTWTKP